MQALSIIYGPAHSRSEKIKQSLDAVRIQAEDLTEVRTLPCVGLADDALRADKAPSAAIHMRGARGRFNEGRGKEDLLLKTGIYDAPYIAVSLNERQDYLARRAIWRSVSHNVTLRGVTNEITVFAIP